jgi:hypothetical protein
MKFIRNRLYGWHLHAHPLCCVDRRELKSLHSWKWPFSASHICVYWCLLLKSKGCSKGSSSSIKIVILALMLLSHSRSTAPCEDLWTL